EAGDVRFQRSGQRGAREEQGQRGLGRRRASVVRLLRSQGRQGRLLTREGQVRPLYPGRVGGLDQARLRRRGVPERLEEVEDDRRLSVSTSRKRRPSRRHPERAVQDERAATGKEIGSAAHSYAATPRLADSFPR